MNKKESSFLNMTLTLFLVTFISSAALGYVYELTKGPKAFAELSKKKNAIKEVVPEFTNNPVEEQYELGMGEDIFTCYPAKKDAELVGTAIEAGTSKGFGGAIRLIVGLLPDGSIYDTAVIEHKETPGLGNKIEKSRSDFSLQFKGKDPSRFRLSVKQDGGDVDGITAATISSRAFCDAVQKAYKIYVTQLE